MTTEQEFKAKVTIVNLPPRRGQPEGQMNLHASIKLVEDWTVTLNTRDAIEDAEDKLRELLWRRWNQMGKKTE